MPAKQASRAGRRGKARAILWAVAGLCAGGLLVVTPAVAGRDVRVDVSELLDQADTEGSIADTLIKLALDPTDVGAHINLGNLYAREGKFDEAERSYERALKLDSENPIAWNNLGVLYLRRGRVDQAASCFDNALDGDKKYALARYNLASILDARGNYDRAVEEYRIAIGQRPDLALVRNNPYVVNNPHLVTVSLLNYLNLEVYSMLIERAVERPSLRLLGVAEPVPTPKR